MTIYYLVLPSYSAFAADMLCDLVTLTCDLLTQKWSYIVGHVLSSCTKFDDPKPIHSCLITCPNGHN